MSALHLDGMKVQICSIENYTSKMRIKLKIS
ncbi:MAG: hypothetical protein KPEEDBHJ_00470 [Anaerolineales bacterium]|nr:hypothetical protein [Anaerolineales bacterium]